MSDHHLSCVETGRSRPCAELLLHLATHPEIPFRARNQLLLGPGYAPAFRERPLDGPEMAPVAAVLESVLAQRTHHLASRVHAVATASRDPLLLDLVDDLDRIVGPNSLEPES